MAALVSGSCARCGTPTTDTCAKCRQRYYCSPSCQEKDWILGHKSACGGKKHPDLTEKPARPSLALFDPQTTHDLMAADVPLNSKGLVNVGNTCYLNSVLQCLFATRPLTAHLLSLHHKGSCRRSSGCMACELENFALEMQEQGSRRSLIPKQIVATLLSLGQDITFGRQEDSHQVLLTVLHALHSAFLQEGSDIPPKMVDQETTLIHQLFGGTLASQLLCPDCGHASTNFESCLDLSLEIHEHTDTLTEMLEAFTCPERLDKQNKIKCQGCKVDVRAHKQITLFEAPNILCIQLKRFRVGFFGKVNKFIQYPSELNLQPFMSPGTEDKDAVYDLYGVLIHLDLFNISSFGHYVACIKGTDGRWRVFDDSEFEVVPEEAVLRQNPYMLFYKRRTTRGLQIAPSSTPVATDKLLEDFRKDWMAELGKEEQQASPSDSKGKEQTKASSSDSKAAAVETAPQEAQVSVPCEAGCGFFGSAAQRNLCSFCFKKRHPEEAAALAAVKAAEEKAKRAIEEEKARKEAEEEAVRLLIMAKEASLKRAESQPKKEVPKKAVAKVGRNDDCPCGSGKKYKKCHGS